MKFEIPLAVDHIDIFIITHVVLLVFSALILGDNHTKGVKQRI